MVKQDYYRQLFQRLPRRWKQSLPHITSTVSDSAGLVQHIHAFLQAGMFCSRLPLAWLLRDQQHQATANIHLMVIYFAIWGGIIATIALLSAALLLALGLPAEMSLAVALLCSVMLSGALHEDGLADCADGWFGGQNPEHRRNIMRDPRVGSFGVLALVFSILLRFLPLTVLTWENAAAAFFLAHIWARGLLPLLWHLHSRPSEANSGSLASTVPHKRYGIVAVLITLFISMWLLPLSDTLILLLVTAVTISIILHVSLRKIGTIAGDSLGAAEQCAEIAVLWSFVIMMS